MKKLILLLAILTPQFTMAQSETTKKFHEEHKDAFTLFFYNSTLSMLNMEGNEEFDQLIKDIDKMKLVRVDKSQSNFTKTDYKQLVSEYKAENFEDLMNMRQSEMNINVLIKEKGGVTRGLLLLMDDNESMSVLDIKGAVPLNKVAKLISQLQNLDDFKGF